MLDLHVILTIGLRVAAGDWDPLLKNKSAPPLLSGLILLLLLINIPCARIIITSRVLPEDMRLNVVRDLLGDLYDIYPLAVDLGDVGHTGASRRRLYVIVALKGSTRCVANPITLYSKLKEYLREVQELNDCRTTPSDYLTADAVEIQLDAMEVACAWAIVSKLTSQVWS